MKLAQTDIAKQVFIAFCDAYNQRDLPAFLKLFTKNAHMWGTAKDENRVGLAEIEMQLRRDWSQAEASSMEPISFVAYELSGQDVLWAAAECRASVTIDGKKHIFEPLRGTIVLTKEGGGWKIAHAHASFPDVRNPENGSFPVGV